ncbi:MAG: hypothetical protein JXA94_06925 [Parachlamydiales bacterium]|nr:hypothetical protein [Parachlamydiales bacterium]
MTSNIYSMPYASFDGLQIYLEKTKKAQEAQGLIDKANDTFQKVLHEYEEKKGLKKRLDEKMRSILRHVKKIDHEIKMQAKKCIKYIKSFDRSRSKIEERFLKAQQLLAQANIYKGKGRKLVDLKACMFPEDTLEIERCIFEVNNSATKVIEALYKVLFDLNIFLPANQSPPLLQPLRIA